MVGRVAAERAGARPRSIVSRTIRSALPDGLHWDILRLYHEVLAGLREAAGRPARPTAWSASASTRGRWTTACSTRRGACSATRSTTAMRGQRRGVARSTTSIAPDRALRAERTPGPPVQHALPAGGGADHARVRAARTMLLIPTCSASWLSGAPSSTEVTNASSTGLLDVRTAATWDDGPPALA